MPRKICLDIKKVENYELALKDNFKGWHLHHRLETHTSDGVLRSVFISMEELKALDMYYNRPANELIYMKSKEHLRLHKNNQSTETINKIKESCKKVIHTNGWNKKVSDSLKGKEKTPLHNKHNSEAQKKFFDNLTVEEYEQWYEQHYTNRSISDAVLKHLEDFKYSTKGTKWFTNGVKDVRTSECPVGFRPGRRSNKK